MKLSLQQIRDITLGAARIEETDRGYRFYRFTEQQEAVYLQASPNDFYKKTFCTAGIRLEFVTDSLHISMETELGIAYPRNYAFHDIFANGTLIAHIGSRDTAVGVFGGSYALPEGLKTVQIYFPWSTVSTLRFLELDDDSILTPVRRPNKMLIFGDSITQGYDATYPSHSYASLLADYLNANARNKGIGGERFFPALLEEPDDFAPDWITVAYGTNDWSHLETDVIKTNMTAFYRRLSALYPEAKIFAITPTWRKDEFSERPSGAFTNVADWIKEVASELPNVTAIDGYGLVPRDPALYADGRLHPNDAGFAYYAERLTAKIKSCL